MPGSALLRRRRHHGYFTELLQLPAQGAPTGRVNAVVVRQQDSHGNVLQTTYGPRSSKKFPGSSSRTSLKLFRSRSAISGSLIKTSNQLPSTATTASSARRKG